MRRSLLIIAIVAFLFAFFFKTEAQTNQTLVNGGTTAPVNFPGTGCTYNWVNNTPSIGLAANGTGNIPSFTAINTGSTPVIATITATPVSKVFAYIVNSNDNTVSVINTTTNAVIATIPVGNSNPFGIAVSPDGKWVYVALENTGYVSVINASTNTVTATIQIGGRPLGVCVSPDGLWVYVANWGSNDVTVINTVTNAVFATIPVTSPYGISVSPDGLWVYVSQSADVITEGQQPLNTVTVIKTATNTVFTTVTVGTQPYGISFNQIGSLVYVANSVSNSVSVINTATNAVVASIAVGSYPGGLCVTPNGNFVYVSNFNSGTYTPSNPGTVSVINTSTNTVVATIPVGLGPSGISCSPDGSRVYVANPGSNNVSVINTATNTIIATVGVGSFPTSFGNFVTGGIGCTGAPTTFTITVNPSIDTIIATVATGNISACSGTASANPLIQQFYVSGSNLKGNITATAPTGFEVSLTSGSGYSNNVTIPETGGIVDSILVYVRSAASAPTGNISGNVVLSSTGAVTQNVAVSGIVNPLPTVNSVPNQIVINGSSTTTVNFTGKGNTFNWVNNTPKIGLAASGKGNISSFTAINTGIIPDTATITVTPISAAFAYINGETNNVSVINTTTNTVVSNIPIGTQGSFCVGVSPDGSRVYLTDLIHNSVLAINTATQALVATIPVGKAPYGLVVSLDGSRVYVANSDDGTISVINTTTNKVVATFVSQPYSAAIAISPDGSKLYEPNTGTNSVSVISTLTNSVVGTITIASVFSVYPDGLAVSPDGSRLYVINDSSYNVSVINTNTNSLLATIPVGQSPYSVVVSPDGSRIYVSNIRSNTISVINTANNSVIATIPVGSSPLGISITSDGSKVYVANDYSSSVSVISTATNTVIATIPVGLGPISFGNFITAGTACAGIPTTFTIIVNPSKVTITTTVATGNISACAGTASVSPHIEQFYFSGNNLAGNIIATAPPGFEVSLAAGSGYANSVSIAQTGGIVDSILVYVRSATSAPLGNISGNVVLSSSGATNQNVAVTGMINSAIIPSVGIAASANNICIGTSVTFTATPTKGGSSPSYQWQVNGNNVGTNSATFTTTTLQNSDVIRCAMISNVTCATGIATSNAITMTVTPSVSPSVSIATSTSNICAGTSVVFTATPINGGTTPTYQWQLNGDNVGTNSATFTSTTLVNGDVIKCSMNSNATCATPTSATSDVITIIILLPVTPSISVSASSNSICSGTTVMFTAAPINGGSVPAFQWMLNGNIVGTNSATYSSSTLANGDVISCAMTSNAPCATGSDVSNIITMNVIALVAPSVSITESANAVCKGTPITFTAFPCNGGNPLYRWLVNGVDAGNNSSTFTSSNLNNGDNISCMMTSSLPCTSPVTSSSISLVIYPLPTVTFIPDTVYTTSNGDVQLTPIVTGTIEKYLWSPVVGLSSADIEEPDASVVNSVTYQLQVTSDHGCTATANITVLPGLPLQMPNAFTPNSDGHNDVFRIPPGVQFTLQEFDIFNSWGIRVFTTNDITKGWDGTYKGLPADVGVYVYMIRGKNPAAQAVFLKGVVVLIR